MTTILLATGNVHEAAALCDYLGDRLDADDTVHALGVANDRDTDAKDTPVQSSTAVLGDATDSNRDLDDALNAVRSRLGALVTVETDTVATEGREYLDVLFDRARAIEADEVVVSSAAAPGELSEIDRPVVVVPTP